MPLADRLTVWPTRPGEYGIDATWSGVSGHAIANRWDAWLTIEGVRHQLRRSSDGAWTLRLGPLPASIALKAIEAFVR